VFRLQCKNRDLPTAPGLPSQALLRAVATLSLLLTSLPLPAQNFTPSECRTRANYLANFPSSVDWPAEVLPSGKAPFLICLFGEFPFGTFLAEITGARRSTIGGAGKYLSAGMGGYVSQLVRSVLLRAEIDRLARAAVHDHGELLARADKDREPLHDLR